MQKNSKKIIVWIVVLVLAIPAVVWGGALAKNRLLTEIHKDKIESMPLAEWEEPLPEFDWYRVTSYSDTKIEIYYVNTAGEYKAGGKITCYNTQNGWQHTNITESILWSGGGSADNYPWPYWHHVFLA